MGLISQNSGVRYRLVRTDHGVIQNSGVRPYISRPGMFQCIDKLNFFIWFRVNCDPGLDPGLRFARNLEQGLQPFALNQVQEFEGWAARSFIAQFPFLNCG